MRPRWMIALALTLGVLTPAAVIVVLLAKHPQRVLLWTAAPLLIAAVVLPPVFALKRVLIRRGYHPGKVSAVLSFVAAALVVLLYTLLAFDSLVKALGNIFFILPLVAGFAVINLGMSARSGSERFCAKCQYPFLDDPGVPRCPECGAPWRGPLGTVTGRLDRDPRKIAVGVLLLALPALSIVLDSVSPGLKRRALPTSVLIGEAISERGFDNEAWTELNRRTLSPEQTLRLARGLIEHRDQTGTRFSRDDELWLAAQVNSPRSILPPELVAQYYRGMIGPLAIQGPAVAKVGQRVRLTLTAPLRTNLRNTDEIRIAPEGWWSDGQHTPPHNPDLAGSPYMLDPNPSPGPISFTFTPERPGVVRVRAALWIAIGPFPGVGWDVTWSAPPGSDAATPTIPGATSWLERRQAEITITVEP